MISNNANASSDVEPAVAIVKEQIMFAGMFLPLLGITVVCVLLMIIFG